MNVIGEFSKSVEGGKSLNFSESGGENCSNKCKLKKGPCYAIKTEKMKPNIKTSGEKKRKLGPVQVANAAIIKLRTMRNIPWFRFCTFGSVPMIAVANKAKGLKETFKRLIDEIEASIQDNNLERVHFPIESPEKAEYYRELTDNRVVIRESCQSERRLNQATKHCSFVIGEKGTPMIERIQQCQAKAKELRAEGKTVVTCGAIKPRNFKGSKRRCGDCTACGNKNVDVVLYALH